MREKAEHLEGEAQEEARRRMDQIEGLLRKTLSRVHIDESNRRLQELTQKIQNYESRPPKPRATQNNAFWSKWHASKKKSA